MSLNVSGSVPFQDGTVNISLVIPVNASGNVSTAPYSLTASEVTIAVPTWAVLCIIEPPAGNTNDLVLRLNSGDTARNISAIAPTLLALDNDELPTDIYLTSSGTDASATTVTFL